MAPSPPVARFTLRDLPLPAKLVLTAFLTAVGLGYLSAMVQLHLKHSSKDGNPLPTPDDVIERFAGYKRFDPAAPKPASKIEGLVLGNGGDPDVSKSNMAPAFFAKSKGYEKDCAARGADAVQAEREGERQAMLAWLRATPADQKAGYDADAFPLPPPMRAFKVTAEFLTGDGAGVRIKSLVDARCQACHAAQGQDPQMDNFTALAPHITPPSAEVVDGKWVRSSKQITVEGLTQSTHAHLLSFAVLFTATGLTFAFTGFPAWVRGTVGPAVLVAQVADIACWWLARVPTYGPYFAQAIMGTGAVVGVGLMVQIVGSLFGMYGRVGKAMLGLLFAAGLATVGVVGVKVIEPALKEQRLEREKEKKAADGRVEKPAPPVGVDPTVEKPRGPAPVPPSSDKPAGPTDRVATVKPMSKLEKLLTGPWDDKAAKFNGSGSMVRAFFDKDSDFNKEFPKRGQELVAEREGERQAVLAWARLPDGDRKKAFEADALELPADLAGKPVTPDYLAEDKKAVKVQSIIADRCARCHLEGGPQEDYPLEEYEQIAKYLVVGDQPAGVETKPASTVVPDASPRAE